MNKSEFIKTVADEAGVSQGVTAKVIDAAISAVMESVAAGEDVSITGFGSFSAKNRAAREGRNPVTGQAMKIDACTVPSFKAGKTFKEKVKK